MQEENVLSRKWKILLALSGLIALLFSLSPNPLTMYPLFVLAYFFRDRLTLKSEKQRYLYFVIAIMLSSLLLEILAWLSNYVEANPEPILFHPQLIPDLLIAVGFYSAWAITWTIALRRYNFTLPSLFITHGLYGVFIEQQGAVFIAGLSTFPVGIIFWLYVFLAYGSTMGLAYLPFRKLFKDEEKQQTRWKYLWVVLALFILVYVTTFIFGLLWMSLGLIPEPGSIIERPFY